MNSHPFLQGLDAGNWALLVAGLICIAVGIAMCCGRKHAGWQDGNPTLAKCATGIATSLFYFATILIAAALLGIFGLLPAVISGVYYLIPLIRRGPQTRGVPKEAVPLAPEEETSTLSKFQGQWSIVPVDVSAVRGRIVAFTTAVVRGYKVTLSGYNGMAQSQELSFKKTPDGTLYIDRLGSRIIPGRLQDNEIAIDNALNIELLWQRAGVPPAAIGVVVDAVVVDPQAEVNMASEQNPDREQNPDYVTHI